MNFYNLFFIFMYFANRFELIGETQRQKFLKKRGNIYVLFYIHEYSNDYLNLKKKINKST